ncbi:MAG: NAD(P)/FAD-dependent oxidoreductase [Halanaeroarchaeum sp.]
MQRVDVAIVGGGPAGTSAAIQAAAADAEVVVVEKGVPRADRDRLGPDSTDAAGFLDYWVDIAQLDVDDLPDDVILREIDSAEFVGPSERLSIEQTGIDSSYDGFGFTFHRARLDDYLRNRAEAEGAEYRVGDGVTDVDTSLTGSPEHELTLADGTTVVADYLVLADGPQRQVTMPVLDQYLPEDRQASDLLDPRTANHIAYQEYREFPPDVFDPDSIVFWWGWMPGETAYPWVFPNEGTVARVGLTMPIGMDLDDVENPADFRLLRADDDRIPAGREYVDRLLEALYGEKYDVEEAFPRVEDEHGKRAGTETYPISSTRPIDSPTEANIAVVGGAMGATSAFHEGGDHVAMRTGRIAGRLAATDSLTAYNRAWRDAIGDEVRRSVTMAEMVRSYTPRDWDDVLKTVNTMLAATGNGGSIGFDSAVRGFDALRLYLRYRWTRFGYRDSRMVQIPESAYWIG